MPKLQYLIRYLKRYTTDGICLAYSGGTDSATLLAVLMKLREDRDFTLLAVYMHSVLQGADTLKSIQNNQNNLPLEIMEVEPLEIPEVLNNTRKRCYACKLNLFSKIIALAASKNIKFIFDGSNLDDGKVFRPGRQALRELGVISPLAECGFTKSDVKELASELGVKIVPSDSCLATRFPYDHKLDLSEIEMVKKAEGIIRNLGFSSVRVRMHDNLVRIEVAREQIELFIKKKAEILAQLKDCNFRHITLDLQGFRSGSMD